jgi:acetyl-CoA acetyltransferase
MNSLEQREMLYIVGMGDTRMGRVPEFTSIELQAAATRDALQDAGISVDEDDGVISAYSLTAPHPMPSSYLALGTPAFLYHIDELGASGTATVGPSVTVV